MYLFYFDESGNRDPNVRDPIYVLLAVGIWEGHWRKLDREISLLKLELAGWLKREGKGNFDLADCEERAEKSPFLNALTDAERTRLANKFYEQLEPCKAAVFAAVIDKRHLQDHVTHETLHKKAYELVLERIENFMNLYHQKHNALIIMDDTSIQLNRAVAMKHAFFQRAGNQNLKFKHIIEYPFFARSELSNGVQLADLCAYNVYRAFKGGDFTYPYFERMLPFFYCRQNRERLDGLKVFPEGSELIDFARIGWTEYQKQKAPREGGA
jgi:hypothetical protein